MTNSLICPITQQLFSVPVLAGDGHTYEESAIVRWIHEHHTSPLTRQPLTIDSLRPNLIVKNLIDEFERSLGSADYLFILDVDVRKDSRAIFQMTTKAVFRAQWLTRPHAPPAILLKISGVRAKREASFCVQLSRHPHIVRTYGIVEPSPKDSIMLLQEYAPEGSLFDLLENRARVPDEIILLEMFAQVTDAMIYLAYNRVTHGDLACRNIVVFRFNKHQAEDNLVKITDFGLTRHSSIYVSVNDGTSIDDCVPVRYAAPEVLRHRTYTEKSDMYSCGVTIVEAFSKAAIPWIDIETDQEIYRRVTAGETLPRPGMCSDQTWSIALTTMQLNPQERPTFAQLRRSLTNRRWQIENDTPSHLELMNKLQRVLEVDMDEVVTGTVVEQRLVNLTGLTIDQTGTTFRRRPGTNITVFRLRMPDDTSLGTFISYYDQFYKNLIVGHERESTENWVRVSVNTSTLYNYMSGILYKE